MIRARIWPSSPQRPQLAFTFDLLDWAETLLLECQVSVDDFCKALQFKCRHLIMKVSILTHTNSLALIIWMCVCQTGKVSVSSYGRVCQTEIVSVSSYGRECVRLR